MAITIKTNTTLAIEEETTDGTYVAPAGASSFLQTLSDGLEITPSKELLERSVYAGTIGKVTPRTGMKSVAGSIPVECRPFSTEGSSPEFDKLIKSALGTSRAAATTTTTKSSGNTATVLQIEDADISKFAVGDIILVKQSGAYHVSPITAISTGSGTATITLLVAHPSGDHTDSVVISKFKTYTVAESGHKSLSITKYVDSAITEKAIGCKITSMSLEGFSTGQIPSFNFGFEGLTFDRLVGAPSYTPSYDTALPPIALGAKLYQDGTAITDVNELTLSVENTLGFATSFSSSNGKISSRVISRTLTGSFNPYKPSDSVANYTKFLNNTQFSLFAYMKNDTSTSGQFENIVAIYLPNVIITEIGETDKDGNLQDTLTFSASRGTSGTTNEVYIGFI